MRFLVISDLHSESSAVDWINSAAERYDVRAILFLGDVTDLGTCEEGRKILEKIEKEVYLIPGNCDPDDMSVKNSDIIKDVHGKAFDIDGIRFAALGGSNPTIFNSPYELSEEEITERLGPISEKVMVLMTHAPSYGILDHIPSGMSVGSKAVREIVRKHGPKVALSGHIHEDFGIVESEGTLFINPGPAKDRRYAILYMDGEKVSAELKRA